MARAVAALVTVVIAGGVLVAGVWLAGRQEPGPALGQPGPEVTEPPEVIEPPEALVCEQAGPNPQIAANEAWPRTIAGYWIDERIFHVAFTEGAEEKVARLAECFPERSFTPVTVERSLQEMVAVLDEMVADRDAIRDGTLEVPGIPHHRYNAGIDVVRNVIGVSMEDMPPEAVETFRTRYGSFLEVKEVECAGPVC